MNGEDELHAEDAGADTSKCSLDPGLGGLISLEECRLRVFSKGCAPAHRTFADWKAKGWFPYLKIGGRIFCDPRAVRAALDERFTVPASE
jgi:hypothetical protein